MTIDHDCGYAVPHERHVLGCHHGIWHTCPGIPLDVGEDPPREDPHDDPKLFDQGRTRTPL